MDEQDFDLFEDDDDQPVVESEPEANPDPEPEPGPSTSRAEPQKRVFSPVRLFVNDPPPSTEAPRKQLSPVRLFVDDPPSRPSRPPVQRPLNWQRQKDRSVSPPLDALLGEGDLEELVTGHRAGTIASSACDLFATFLRAAAHVVVCRFARYPPHTFEDRTFQDVQYQFCADPEVKEYVDETIAEIRNEMRLGKVQRICLSLTNELEESLVAFTIDVFNTEKFFNRRISRLHDADMKRMRKAYGRALFNLKTLSIGEETEAEMRRYNIAFRMSWLKVDEDEVMKPGWELYFPGHFEDSILRDWADPVVNKFNQAGYRARTMANQQPPQAPGQLVSPFPAPPIYARNYTSENIALGRAPPPPPVCLDFMAFGEEYHLEEEIIRPLAQTGIRQLYTNKNDWKNEMKKLNRSAVAAFCDLIAILVKCPDHPERVEKLNDIHDIFINMHHLVNEFRPIQARDTLKLMQRKQLDDLEQTVKKFRDFVEGAKRQLRTVIEQAELTRLPVPARRPDLEDPDDDNDNENEDDEVIDVGDQRRQYRETTLQRIRREAAERLGAGGAAGGRRSTLSDRRRAEEELIEEMREKKPSGDENDENDENDEKKGEEEGEGEEEEEEDEAESAEDEDMEEIRAGEEEGLSEGSKHKDDLSEGEGDKDEGAKGGDKDGGEANDKDESMEVARDSPKKVEEGGDKEDAKVDDEKDKEEPKVEEDKDKDMEAPKDSPKEKEDLSARDSVKDQEEDKEAPKDKEVPEDKEEVPKDKEMETSGGDEYMEEETTTEVKQEQAEGGEKVEEV